jgi:hypothetical protein
MTLSLATKQKGPLDKARSNIEAIASNLYYSLTLNNYILKLQSMPLPTRITIDDIMENDFVIGNIMGADAIMQDAQMISA